ncbi:MAG: F0F1 ATP synthase subunit B [Flavobacteriaceae bacterium]|jgi:F-type H+-transporting ATPase subunit b|nr:F0F1 ATP synthase subunit B [Flavobacteriaceae bacterium]
MEKLLEEFSLGLFFWQTLLFVGLLFLLAKYAWKPILSAVEERENTIKDSLEAAEKAKADMEAVQADNKRILKEARAERDALLAEAKKTSTQIVNEAKEAAQTEADKIAAAAQSAIQQEKNAAINDLKAQVAGLSVDIAQKVLQGELADQKKQEQLVEKLVKDIEIK